MKIFRQTSMLVAAVLSLLSSGFACSEVVVVVNESENVVTQNSDDIADLFLNKRNDLSGIRLVPVDLPEGSVVRDKFYETVVRKNSAQVKSYWSRLIFTGKGAPPKQLSSDAEIAELVAEGEGFIGYINAESVVDGIKVIYTLPK